MSITKEFDTITAISTPLGEGAIGIVRLSGTDAVAIANKVFKGKNFQKRSLHILSITVISWKMMKPLMKSWSVLCVHQRPLHVRMS